MALASGARLGPYEIVAPIGAGGMGEVYRAHDSRLERQVAVKVLPEHLSRCPQALSRFAREIKVVAALSHPNLAYTLQLNASGGTAPYTWSLLETLRAGIPL
jgi:serine/threonine protein kinase